MYIFIKTLKIYIYEYFMNTFFLEILYKYIVHFLQKQHQIVFRKLYVGNGDEDWVADRIMTPELK